MKVIHNMMNHSEHCGWNTVWVTLFLAMFGFYLIMTPKFSDDLWYMEGWGSWFIAHGIDYPGDGINPFTDEYPTDEVTASIKQHFGRDNVRLSNITATLLMPFPKWVGSGIAFAAFAAAVLGCFRLARIERRSWIVAAGLALWTFTMPWNNFMGSLIFQFNYIVPSGMAVLLLLWVRKNPRGAWQQAGIFLLALLTGMWHEGFAVPLFVSIVSCLIAFKRCRTRAAVLMATGLVVSLLWHFGYRSSTFERVLTRSILDFYPGLLLKSFLWRKLLFIALLLMVILICKRGFKAYLRQPKHLFLWAAMLSVVPLSYVSTEARAGWWGDICLLMLVLGMTRDLWGSRGIGYRGWRFAVGCLLLGAVFVELTMLDEFTWKFRQERRRIHLEYCKAPGKPIFSDLIAWPWNSWWMVPTVPQNWHLYFMLEPVIYCKDIYHKGLKIIPAELRRVREKDGVRLEGNAGMLEYKGHLFAPDINGYDFTYPMVGEADFGIYKRRDTEFIVFSFESEADGRRYVYIAPVYQWQEKAMLGIRGITVKKEGHGD